MKRKNGKPLNKGQVALDNLVRAVALPLTPNDLELIEEVKQLSRDRCKRGLHHTCSIILSKSGKHFIGLQQTYRRAADIETCAEEVAKGNLQFEQEVAETVVTAHFMPIAERDDGGVTTIVPPCSGCATRLRHLAQTQNAPIGVIIDYKGKPIKIPIECFTPFNYPIAYNGDGTSKF